MSKNINEKFQFGIGIGVPILSYEERRIYREDDPNDDIPIFNSLRYEDFLSTSGSGLNLKAGVIFKPAKFINVGLAYQSRTRYSLTDNFSNNLEYDYTFEDHDGPLFDESPDGSFSYNLKSPMTLSGSLGVVIARSGFISTEIQYKNYANAKFDYGTRNGGQFSGAESQINSQINNDLSNALTIRTGAEVAISKFRVRAGIELDQSPFDGDSSLDPTYNTGFGYRSDKFFADIALQYFTLEQGVLPYVVTNSSQPFVEKDIANTRLVATVAFRW